MSWHMISLSRTRSTGCADETVAGAAGFEIGSLDLEDSHRPDAPRVRRIMRRISGDLPQEWQGSINPILLLFFPHLGSRAV